MPKLILDKKQFLTGLSSGGYSQDGLFRQSYTKGIDIFQVKGNYGLLKQGYAPTSLTNNGTTAVVVDTIKWFVQKEQDFYGYGDDGYLYKFPISTNYTPQVLNSGGENGRVGGKGLAIYNNGTADLLHYFAGTTAGTYNFSSTYNNSYITGLQNAPHPAKEFQGVLYFGNGNLVGSITGTTVVTAALTLPTGYEVQDIDIYNSYIAILAHKPTGAINTECKIFLWDGYTTGGWNFEYTVPEKAYSLEKYRDGLAIFGFNIRLFGVAGYANFDVIHNIESTTVYPGQTYYSNNTLYWQEYGFLGSFGTPDSRIKPSLQAPLTNTGEKGAIINTASSGTQFIISRNNDTCNIFNSGYSGGSVQSINIDFQVPSKINRITFIFDKLVSGGGFSFSLYSDLSTLKSGTVTYASYGATTMKSFTISDKVSNYFYFTLNWADYTSVDTIIKKIIIDYQPTELKEI